VIECKHTRTVFSFSKNVHVIDADCRKLIGQLRIWASAAAVPMPNDQSMSLGSLSPFLILTKVSTFHQVFVPVPSSNFFDLQMQIEQMY